MIEMVKKHFPNLYILVRSENRDDAYDQMNAGIMHIYRETLDTSLRVGIDVMKLLGHNTYEATRSARTFLHTTKKRSSISPVSAIRTNTSVRCVKKSKNWNRSFLPTEKPCHWKILKNQ